MISLYLLSIILRFYVLNIIKKSLFFLLNTIYSEFVYDVSYKNVNAYKDLFYLLTFILFKTIRQNLKITFRNLKFFCPLLL